MPAYPCRVRPVLLLLAALLTVMPASGFALCVADSGHVALELVGTGCQPAGGTSCMTCSDCEDTPLSVGAAHRTATHAVVAPVLLADATGIATASVHSPVAPTLPKNPASRTPLLRC